jgi:nicotinamide N-methyltransferase
LHPTFHSQWSGSVQIADYLAAHPELVAGKRIVEVGAAAALPSLVALSLGAEHCLITDYPSDHLLSAIRVNVHANAAILGLAGTYWESGSGNTSAPSSTNNSSNDNNPAASSTYNTETATILDSGVAEERCVVEGHLWGSPLPARHNQAFDVCIVAECLWNHPQHAALLASLNGFLKPGGVVLLSYAHHIPGCEEADDAFFAMASAAPFGFAVNPEVAEQRPMRYMWDADKTTDQILRILAKPDAAAAVVAGAMNEVPPLENLELREGTKPGPSSANRSEQLATDTPVIRTQQVGAAHFLVPKESPTTIPEVPHDSASLANELRRRAAVIASAEDEGRQAPLELPRDAQGLVLPATIPGPRAPRHEDHPAFGMKVWPPPQPTAKTAAGGAATRGAQALPAWVCGQEEKEETPGFPSWAI